jgi:phosphatidylserine/phosphatidylglycerophosphate/cardiolipin synthase-like enzyme
MLDVGAIVARSSDSFSKYHAKMMIVDSRVLHVYGFNFTHLDVKSRSFGIITSNQRLVRQAIRLFEDDVARRPYGGGSDGLIVSPENARERLEAFIAGARRKLLIYDSRLGDRRILRLLAERIRAGVAVRIIGHVGKDIYKGSGCGTKHDGTQVDNRHQGRVHEPTLSDESRFDGRVSHLDEDAVRAGLLPMSNRDFDRADLRVEKLHHRRLHLRAIVRDGTAAFVGSQSLRKAELDSRRELGVFVHEPDIVRQIQETFERDWRPDAPYIMKSAERVNAVI